MEVRRARAVARKICEDEYMFKTPFKMDLNKLPLAVMLVVIGVCGRILFINYANIETVLAIALLSGILLGGFYFILVPLFVMLISDWWIYTYTDYGSAFGIEAILGLTVFTWTGYIMVGLLGRYIKPKVAYTVRGVAVVVGYGLIATLIYDIWTAVGFYLFMTPRTSEWLIRVFIMQIPFSIYHIMSSLIFVPLLTTIFMYVHVHGVPYLSGAIAPSDQHDEGG
ncbi:MAG: hypothetical protein JSV56_02875 [Methanomassiliicoccales archaeon]|nr:MAG: hypothetical protein JSV56_02875 [Methanomassiliicoccales archaeon]